MTPARSEFKIIVPNVQHVSYSGPAPSSVANAPSSTRTTLLQAIGQLEQACGLTRYFSDIVGPLRFDERSKSSPMVQFLIGTLPVIIPKSIPPSLPIDLSEPDRLESFISLKALLWISLKEASSNFSIFPDPLTTTAFR